MSSLLVVGISGVTGGGKTTLAAQLRQVLPQKRVHVISQDDYFLDDADPRHILVPELNHINFEVLSSLDMEKMFSDVGSLLQNKKLFPNTVKKNLHLSEDITSYVCERIRENRVEILIIEGFLIFNYEPWLPWFNLKYYFTLSKQECQERRERRLYDPPDCPGYFNACVWPEHLKRLAEVKDRVLGIKYIAQSFADPLEQVLLDIAPFLE